MNFIEAMDYLKSNECERKYPVLKKDVLIGYDRNKEEVYFYRLDTVEDDMKIVTRYSYNNDKSCFKQNWGEKKEFTLDEMMENVERLTYAQQRYRRKRLLIPQLEKLYRMEHEMGGNYDCYVELGEQFPTIVIPYGNDFDVKIYFDSHYQEFFALIEIAGNRTHMYLDCIHAIHEYVDRTVEHAHESGILKDDDTEDDSNIDYQ